MGGQVSSNVKQIMSELLEHPTQQAGCTSSEIWIFGGSLALELYECVFVGNPVTCCFYFLVSFKAKQKVLSKKTLPHRLVVVPRSLPCKFNN